MKNVIVTGANGFIGNSLIKKLIENNVKVVAVDISFAAPRLPETDLITKIEATVYALMRHLPIRYLLVNMMLSII